MKRTFLAALVAAFALSTVGAGAQMEATPAPKPSKPNFGKMAQLVGTWSCAIKSARRPAPYYVTQTYEMDPGGYWLNGKSTTKAMAWFPYENNATDRITYDADTKRWIDVNYDELGGYDLSTSPGFVGNSITWTSLAFAKTKDVASQGSTTVTWASPTKMTSVSTFVTGKGRSVRVTGTCTKQSGSS